MSTGFPFIKRGLKKERKIRREGRGKREGEEGDERRKTGVLWGMPAFPALGRQR